MPPCEQPHPLLVTLEVFSFLFYFAISSAFLFTRTLQNLQPVNDYLFYFTAAANPSPALPGTWIEGYGDLGIWCWTHLLQIFFIPSRKLQFIFARDYAVLCNLFFIAKIKIMVIISGVLAMTLGMILVSSVDSHVSLTVGFVDT